MTVVPESLGLREQRVLVIRWSDGEQHEYAANMLREACPCANCREARRKPKPAALLPVLKPEEARPLVIENVHPVGSYAYAIEFSDGHNTGIFTLDHLRQLGEAAQ